MVCDLFVGSLDAWITKLNLAKLVGFYQSDRNTFLFHQPSTECPAAGERWPVVHSARLHSPARDVTHRSVSTAACVTRADTVTSSASAAFLKGQTDKNSVFTEIDAGQPWVSLAFFY